MKRVIVIFPHFDNSEAIEQLRRKFDPLAASVKAHLTLVAPCESDLSSEQLRHHIQAAVRHIAPFPIRLAGITGHEDEYLFLNVKRGNDELIGLRDCLYTGPLATHLLPQYTYVPHITVGRVPDEAAFFAALALAQATRTLFETHVTEISVYAIHSDGTRPVEFSVALES